MKTLMLFAALSAAVITGCATVPAPSPSSDAQGSWITPREAINLAADAAPRGVEGTFALTVKATGAEGGETFLNSELDYRDQRNLTVAVSPAATRQLAERLGEHPRTALMGRDILVHGAAVRTRIDFTSQGRPTGKYYYQTHVKVIDARQITIR